MTGSIEATLAVIKAVHRLFEAWQLYKASLRAADDFMQCASPLASQHVSQPRYEYANAYSSSNSTASDVPQVTDMHGTITGRTQRIPGRSELAVRVSCDLGTADQAGPFMVTFRASAFV